MKSFLKSENTAKYDLQPLGIQFDIKPQKNASPLITIRPVALGPTGTWVRTALVWQRLPYLGNQLSYEEEHFDLLKNLFVTNQNEKQNYLKQTCTTIELNTCSEKNIWEELLKAQTAGVHFVKNGENQTSITIEKSTANLVVNLTQNNQTILMRSGLALQENCFTLKNVIFIGEPAHGVFVQKNNTQLSLIKLEKTLEKNMQETLLKIAEGKIYDPTNFSSENYAKFQGQVKLVSSDNSFKFPKEPKIKLLLNLKNEKNHQLQASWSWEYDFSTTNNNKKQIQKIPFLPNKTDKIYRYQNAEEEIFNKIKKVFSEIEDSPNKTDIRQVFFQENFTLSGMQTIYFVQQIFPKLKNVPQFNTKIKGKLPDYKKTNIKPIIEIETISQGERRDWFGLNISVKIAEEEIPFNLIFKALVAGSESVILPSGTYFSLNHNDFHKLNDLIQEARSLQDTPTENLQISRFNGDLWQELQQLGVVKAQAQAWEETVQDLQEIEFINNQILPTNFQATLRQYQQEGFDWLMFLYTHGLGGILADDMGLGKTLQTLAFISKVKQNFKQKSKHPFLVVAPTSVVGNWDLEAKRFTPDLKVLVIEGTLAKQKNDFKQFITNFDIVITSYTLLRIDEHKYYQQNWSGLILDEAQAAKNYKSKVYQCVKRLDVPFKFMITGTPMENNLMELWAMFSLVAPGLFPQPKRFAEYYQRPIERDNDQQRLAQLKQKIKPLMLRRTKEEVALDLPEKQEQIIEVVLNPAHRKIYDTQLQRERQKVLGLVEDLNYNRFAIFQSLTLLRQLSLDPSLLDEKHVDMSSKLDVLFELLEDIVAEKHRVLIFSQFTRFLSKVKQRLEKHAVDYVYLDGNTRNRSKVIKDFKEGSATVFLISLKAGGVGLNLTEADYCILLDPWWNPAAEAQAVDRTHRIGQTKNVMVYRLVAKDTVEEKVMALKRSKAALFSGVMGEQTAGDMQDFENKKITAEDIKALLS